MTSTPLKTRHRSGFFPIHLRNALRRGLMDDYQYMPAKKISGFRFADPSAKFIDAEKRAKYVHLNRQARRLIHEHYRDRLIADVVDTLKVSVRIRRQLVNHRRVEVLEIANGPVCILAVLRNWVNPLFQSEIPRIKMAMDRMAKKLATKYSRVWKYLMVPSVEQGQTTLDTYGDLQIYRLPYLRPPGLNERLTREAGCDYSEAYAAECYWPSNLVELLLGTWGRLLRRNVGESIKDRNINTHDASGTSNSLEASQHKIWDPPISYSFCIVSIRRAVRNLFHWCAAPQLLRSRPNCGSVCVFGRF